MSRLIVIGSVAVASAALLTGTAAAVGVVASKSQTSTSTNTNSQVRVVAPAAAVSNETVKQAINVATAKPAALPPVKVKKITIHAHQGGSQTPQSAATSSKPRTIIILRHVVTKTTGKHRVVIVTVTQTASPSPSASPTWHDDNGGDGGTNPSPSPGGGDD